MAVVHDVFRATSKRVTARRVQPCIRIHFPAARAHTNAALRPSVMNEGHVLNEWPSPVHRRTLDRDDAEASRETTGPEDALRAAAPVGLNRVALGSGAHSGYQLAEQTILQAHSGSSGILSFCSSYTERDPGARLPEVVWPGQKFPLQWHIEANVREEQRCLAEVERLIEEWPVRISAMLVEPVFTCGATRFASATFFRSLRQLLQDMKVLMIIDERRTGFGTTGMFILPNKLSLTYIDFQDPCGPSSDGAAPSVPMR